MLLVFPRMRGRVKPEYRPAGPGQRLVLSHREAKEIIQPRIHAMDADITDQMPCVSCVSRISVHQRESAAK